MNSKKAKLARKLIRSLYPDMPKTMYHYPRGPDGPVELVNCQKVMINSLKRIEKESRRK